MIIKITDLNFKFQLNILKKILTCLEKTAMSSLKLSDEQTSPPATPGSRGVHVANSHFSNINASNGNNGCLKNKNKIHLNLFSSHLYEIMIHNLI